MHINTVIPLGTCLLLCTFWPSVVFAASDVEQDDQSGRTVPDPLPDLRDDDTNLKLQKGDLVIVPIPFSNPTLDTGLVLGGAYFYPQTPEEKKAQPASLTAAAALYTSNKSLAVGIAQQSYWDENNWRFTGIAGHADLKLVLRAPESDGGSSDVDWLVKGEFIDTTISRRFTGKWFAGLSARYIIMSEDIDEVVEPDDDFDTGESTKSVGLGVVVELDNRDRPFNSASGNFLKVDALFNTTALGSDNNYQLYSANYRSFHSLSDSWVLAWELRGCARSGMSPLWDACRVALRGFPATDYLSKTSASGQAELRWQMSPRWGAVVFAGAGFSGNSFSDSGDNESIPSYGLGARFMVVENQRINVRLDYGWSRNSEALYLSFAEAF